MLSTDWKKKSKALIAFGLAISVENRDYIQAPLGMLAVAGIIDRKQPRKCIQ